MTTGRHPGAEPRCYNPRIPRGRLLRRIFYVLLLLCLPLYGLAMQGGLPHTDASASLAHALEHEKGVYHHHDVDGSVHYDQSDESIEHVQDHSCSSQPAGSSMAALAVPPEQQIVGRTPFLAQAVSEPYLDGPRKPPRHALGHAAGGTSHT